MLVILYDVFFISFVWVFGQYTQEMKAVRIPFSSDIILLRIDLI